MHQQRIKTWPEGSAKVAGDTRTIESTSLATLITTRPSQTLQNTDTARPTSRRIPVTKVARIIPAFDGMRACGSAPAFCRPRQGFAARGAARSASKAHGVRPANRTARIRIR